MTQDSAGPRVELTAAGVKAEVDLLWGGRLSSLEVGGHQLLVAGPPAGVAFPELQWGAYLMAPWVGRVANAKLISDKGALSLRANFPPHAIHGLVFDATVEVLEARPDRIRTVTPLAWPLGGHVVQTALLSDTELQLSVEITAGHSGFPVSAGWHPWFRRDGAEVCLLANEVLEQGADQIPTGQTKPVDRSTDLRGMRRIGDLSLDTVYPNVARPAVITWPGLHLEISFEPLPATYVVYTAPHGFCVEPQSSWPNAANLEHIGVRGTGHRTLEPGSRASFATQWRWSY